MAFHGVPEVLSNVSGGLRGVSRGIRGFYGVSVSFSGDAANPSSTSRVLRDIPGGIRDVQEGLRGVSGDPNGFGGVSDSLRNTSRSFMGASTSLRSWGYHERFEGCDFRGVKIILRNHNANP